MLMVTTCPACHTRFRVTPEQMDAHGGDVRCGRCAKVFNAHAYLEQELEELQHEGQSTLHFEEPVEQAAISSTPSFSAEEEWGDEPLSGPLFEEVPVAEEFGQPLQEADELLSELPAEVESTLPESYEQALSTSSEAAELPASALEEPSPTEPTVLASQFVAAPPAAPDTLVQTAVEPRIRRFFWLWLIGAMLLLASLAVQGLYFFRSDLAARHPEFKPLLQQLCGALQCSIRLPANPDLLSIETSNLEADPQQANLIALNAILRNRAKLAQEYPQFELTLTDTQDRMIARRVFTPLEYAKGADLNRGMAPNEEIPVKLNLDLGSLKAAGYRVLLFYTQ